MAGHDVGPVSGRPDPSLTPFKNERNLRVHAEGLDFVVLDHRLELADIDGPDPPDRLGRLFDSLPRGVFPALFRLGQQLDNFYDIRHDISPGLSCWSRA